MKLKIIIAVSTIAWAGMSVASAQKVTMYSTTSTHRWTEKKYSLDKSSIAQVDVCVYPDSLLQDVVGFGGTFNELGWDALQHLPQAERDKVMASLFSKEGVCFALGQY